MKHKTILMFVIILFLLLFGLGGSAFVLLYRSRSDDTGRTAWIYQNGVCIQTIDLDTVTEPYTFEIKGEDGASNTIEVRPGEIAVISASCPDKVCVHMGFIKNEMLPISCLPNKLIIRIENNHASQADDPDAVSH